MLTPNKAVDAQIAGIALVVSDLSRSIAFYCEGLGFSLENETARVSSSNQAFLSLGGISLRLTQFARPGASYPSDALANDPWFQHFAIRVADMDEAYACLSRQDETPISTGGPQQLPPSTGSVVAYKFRDPDGHPLELSFAPGAPTTSDGPLFITIDHSAIVVADLKRSLDFYTQRLGFVETERLLNEGPTQARLDGLSGSLVDIVILRPPCGAPHLELLHYRSPKTSREVHHCSAQDIAATKLVVVHHVRFPFNTENDRTLVDPDGHRIELAGRTTS